ncbi:MAG: PEP-CTERM sorting domain-containing protein [Fimbriimonadaceae bacterium]|nr:PEP-CTERM sorting domain-containing protein [Fimbriimonadaceae bacterium]
MRTPFLRNLICVAALSAVASSVFAHDDHPPPWRGQPGTTYQHWQFGQPPTPGQPYLPDGGWQQNPGLTAPPLLLPGAYEWLPTFEGMTGVICLPPGSRTTFRIPNYDDSGHDKEIRVQFTWWSAAADTIVEAFNSDHSPAQITTEGIGGGWYNSVATFMLDGCPDFENVHFDNRTSVPIYLDQVVIDTLCGVPEPATMAALGLGLAFMARRKKK